ncbi:MAG: SH3 domain-containing protein [Chloroflexi bacterium]|nr:SH3 domain-containing protein [Chloroflexota bacterium]
MCALLLGWPAALPAAAQDAVIDPEAGRVNLRAAPSLEASILDVLPGGARLSVLRLSASANWVYVLTEEGEVGWVYRELTSFTVEDAGVILDGRVALTPEQSVEVSRLYAVGQARGLHGERFVKVGDSLSVADQWLKPISEGYSRIADYGYLQNAIDGFSGESYARASLATGIGWTTFSVLAPSYADEEQCLEGESPLLCEYRLMQPAVALILLGSNDVGILDAGEYAYNLRRIIDLTRERGIIPVLSTIPLRIGFEERVDAFNQIVRGLAAEYHLPLIDTYAALWLLPGHGLDEDGVHMNAPPRGFEGSVDFRASNLYYGHVVRNLTTLQMLTAIREVLDAS